MKGIDRTTKTISSDLSVIFMPARFAVLYNARPADEPIAAGTVNTTVFIRMSTGWLLTVAAPSKVGPHQFGLTARALDDGKIVHAVTASLVILIL
jgi:hypothetical protein